jgi:hypothetical protein
MRGEIVRGHRHCGTRAVRIRIRRGATNRAAVVPVAARVVLLPR